MSLIFNITGLTLALVRSNRVHTNWIFVTIVQFFFTLVNIVTVLTDFTISGCTDTIITIYSISTNMPSGTWFSPNGVIFITFITIDTITVDITNIMRSFATTIERADCIETKLRSLAGSWYFIQIRLYSATGWFQFLRYSKIDWNKPPSLYNEANFSTSLSQLWLFITHSSLSLQPHRR